MKLSICIPPGPDAIAIAQYAEKLGYDRIWLYDSVALYEDIWVHLALIAQATKEIGLGTAVLVPDNRGVMTTASGIATIERLAPQRLACAFGTGYTGRRAMGQSQPLPWAHVKDYIQQLRSLLNGAVVSINGNPCQMLHHQDLSVARPIEVPLLISAFGQKGLAIAREIADGWMGVSPPPNPFEMAVQMVNGTVLSEGEPANSQRAIAALAPWTVGTYHMTWETNRGGLHDLPGGKAWLDVINQRAEDERHLSVHHSHLTALNDADMAGMNSCNNTLPSFGWVGTADEIKAKAEDCFSAGTTDIMYTPVGPDIFRELRAFYTAVNP